MWNKPIQACYHLRLAMFTGREIPRMLPGFLICESINRFESKKNEAAFLYFRERETSICTIIYPL